MSGAGVALPRPDRGASLGRLGAIWGLAFSVALGARLIHVQTERPGGGVIAGLAFATLYVTPFAVAAYALRSGDPRFQIAVWAAAGVVGLALSFSSLAGVTLFLLPAAGLLLAGAWLRHRGEPGHLSMPAGASLSLVVCLLVGAGAVAVRRIDARREGPAA